MGEFICKIFSWPLIKFYEFTGNYGVSIIIFALLVNVIMTPFMAKSKKSMMRSSRLQPKLQELQKKHEGNPQKLQAETQKLYKEEGVNPMSGCLWSLIPFPILIALYSVIRQPLTRMMFVSQELVDKLRDFFVTQGWYVIPAKADAYVEIKLADIAHQHWAELQAAMPGQLDGLMNIDFGFLGLNLGAQPKWNFFLSTDWSDTKIWLPALGLFLIPFISAFLSWASMKIGNMANPQQMDNSQAAATTKSMTLMMPLMSIWICFIMPAAMGIYWIANSVFGMVRDFVLTKLFRKQLDLEDADRKAARAAREKELEEKRLETERLRAEGKSNVNSNTSKKNLQAKEKQKQDERRAALEKAERAARRERLGIKDAEKPDSQVGNRRYARGRAYVADRYSNPEEAEANTLAAAEESEFAASIDETVEDDVMQAVENTEAVETDEANNYPETDEAEDEEDAEAADQEEAEADEDEDSQV